MQDRKKIKGFINFGEVCQQVLFKTLLDYLGVSYQETEREIKGEINGWKFLVNKETNLFISPDGDKNGSLINFYSESHGVSLREAAFTIARLFIAPHHKLKNVYPEIELIYTPEVQQLGLSREICKKYEIGMVLQRSNMDRKIVFKLYDQESRHIGYIGKEVKKDKWIFTKGIKRNFVYNGYRVNCDYCIMVPDVLSCVRLVELGFSYCVSTLGVCPTEEQMEKLKRYKRIMLIHPEPNNTLLKLTGQSFVKVSQNRITKATTAAEIRALF